MNLRIQLVTIPVDDQDRAKAFYIECLGCTERTDMRFGEGLRWVQLSPPGGGTDIVLFTAPGHEKRVGQTQPICWTTDHIGDTYDTLRDRGVHFREPPTRQPWGGTQAIFEDSEGNVLVLHD